MDTTPAPDNALRPLTNYLAGTFTVAARRVGALGTIALIGWAPVAAALYLALSRGLGDINLTELTANLTTTIANSTGQTPAGAAPDPLGGLVADPAALTTWLLVTAALYLPAQGFVSTATSHQAWAYHHGRPATIAATLRWAARRSIRTTRTIGATIASVATPLLAAGVLAGATGNPAIVAVALLGALVAGAAIWARISLAATVAALAPTGTRPLRTSKAVTGGHTLGLLGRAAITSLIVSAAVGAVATPLALAGATGNRQLVLLAFVARATLSLASGAIAGCANTLNFDDLDGTYDSELDAEARHAEAHDAGVAG